MNREKAFKDISWLVDEPTYRADEAYSYSTLAKFNREGFSKIDCLFDKTSSPSLTFGSMVDTLLTDGKEAFDERFYVATIPAISDTIIAIVDALFAEFSMTHTSLNSIPMEEIVGFASRFNYQPRWKPETRAKDIIEKGSAYYDTLYLSSGKEVVTSEMYDNALACIDQLRNSVATKKYFQPDNKFEDIERLYQLKFKGEYNGIPLRCMADLIIVDYKNKTVTPCDLKTSSHLEYEFHKSFIQWNYWIQAQLYWYLIRQTMDKDPYFKDFELKNYVFIVVSNQGNPNPLTWTYDDTKAETDCIYGRNKNVVCKNWRTLVTTLDYYLKTHTDVPKGITKEEPNNIIAHLNE